MFSIGQTQPRWNSGSCKVPSEACSSSFHEMPIFIDNYEMLIFVDIYEKFV